MTKCVSQIEKTAHFERRQQCGDRERVLFCRRASRACGCREREKTLMGGAASEGKTALLGLCAVLVVLRAG
jgi:hypothetical protein